MSTISPSRVPFPVSRLVSNVARSPLPYALLLALLAAGPLLGPGLVNTRGGGDSPFLLVRTLEMADNLRHGLFPPRWMSHAAYDLGYPFFNHYAALPYYLSGGLTALGLSPLLAIQATQTFGFLLAALTLALWAGRHYRSPWAVVLAAGAYTFAPFHLVNVYVRGDSLSEFYAFVWYPLILWTLDRLAERRTAGRVVAVALAYGALILTHNVSAAIFTPFGLLYILVQPSAVSHQPSTGRAQLAGEGITRYALRTLRDALRRIDYAALAALALGVALTAWFWLPAVAEISYGQLGPAFTEGYFNYSNHFRGLNLVQPTFAFNYRVAGEVSAAGPFAMGLVQALLALVGSLALLWQGTRQTSHTPCQASTATGQPLTAHGSRLTFYVLFSLALATFMITPLSKPLWDHLPVLPTTQFPWRFLSVQALFTAIATGAIANSTGRMANGETTPQQGNESTHGSLFTFHVSPFTLHVLRFTFHIALLTLIVAAALLSLRPERLWITADDVTWDNLLLYESFTGNIGTTIRYEYLPHDVVPRLYISEAVVDGVAAMQPIADADGVTLTAECRARTPARQEWRLTLEGGPAPVVFPLNGWPGWRAEVDGAPATTYPLTGSGRLTVDLPAGEHTVVLRLGRTPLRLVAELGSALTAIGVLLWLALQRRGSAAAQRFSGTASQQRGQLTESAGPFSPVLLSTGLLAIALLVTVAGSLLPASYSRLHAFDFIHAPYPHREPVRFGPLWLEEVYATSGETPDPLALTAAPGERLGLALRWRQTDTLPITGTLRLVSPAEPRHGIPYCLAETTFALPPTVGETGTAGYSLTLPPDLARGLYLLELRLYGPEGELPPQTPQGTERGTLYIGAVRVRAAPARRLDAPVVAHLGELTLHSVTVLRSDPDAVRLQLAWSLARRTPRNYSLSLRLRDLEGNPLVTQDFQPGYGYLPTTLWHADESITDYPVLPLPAGIAPGEYRLQIIAYQEATLQAVGETEIPLRLTGVTRHDPSCCELTQKGTLALCEAAGIRLNEVELPPRLVEGEALAFYAHWNALVTPTVELTARWEVLAADGTAVAMRTGPLAPGSRATDWPQFAWVRAPVHLDLPAALPAGPYRLRLTLNAHTCLLPSALPVQLRAREFTVPPLAHPQRAAFGGLIRLHGYDLLQGRDQLTLTLWWQAEQAPGRDYKRFVHLFNPATEQVPVQDDAMPRAWTYPTSQWVAGEVVSETVTLPLSGLAPGEYRLAVGWYDPATVTRLPATDAAGQPLPLDRAVLDVPVRVSP